MIRYDKDKKGNYRMRQHKTLESWYSFLTNTSYHQIVFTTPSIKDCDDSHPWTKYINSGYAIAANGELGKTLYVQTGLVYSLTLMDDKTNIMLTLDPKGGKDAKAWHEDFVVVNKTSLLIKILPSFPTICYYQSVHREFLGGVIIHIRHDSEDEDEKSTCSTCKAREDLKKNEF